MRIGFITDEISPDLREAIKTGLAWGVHDFELRMIGERRVPDIAPENVTLLRDLLRTRDIRFTAISPGVFKGPLSDRDRIRRELADTLPRTLALADTLAIPTIIVFSFQKSEQPTLEQKNVVMEYLAATAELAARAGRHIAVENEPGYWCDCGSATAALLRDIDHPHLRANWDPANAVSTGEPPYPDGYEALKPWIINVHIKDTPEHALKRCVPVGEGRVDWRGQLRAIRQDRLVGVVTIETHCLPLKEKSRLNLQRVREMLGDEMN
ncbi:MAG: sugar phosphate isomerase/epimerase family protein [candidate division KSB1 bacterium]|nr:sugar phosphate isomerase/epimerase family protein [candidate division KSB1 bacterium]MDQ7065321.1 sugar phosphate isomerase/epimerase family protein [candidate division KSB1 bacterium]